MERFIELEDLFEVKCKKCGSIDVDLTAEDCHECGEWIGAECKKCGSKYDYHDFKKVKK